MSTITRPAYLFLFLLLFFSLPVLSQKKVLDHSVYDSWKSLSNIGISDEGRYAVSIVRPQEGDDCLLVRDLKTDKELRVERGYKYTLVPDKNILLVQIKAAFADTRQAKIKKTSDEKMPKDSLIIVSLADFKKKNIPNVNNYKTGRDFSDYVAYTISDTLKVKDKKRPKAYTLVLHNLTSGSEDTLRYVTDYTISRNGQSLAAITQPAAKDSLRKPQALVYNLAKNDKRVISTAQKEYKYINLSDDGRRVAFLATADSLKKEIKEYRLYYYTAGLDSAVQLVNAIHPAMEKGWSVSEDYRPKFSENGNRLLFGTAPVKLAKDTTIPDFEKAGLDIWHWQEPEIQPLQLVRLDDELKRSYLACIDLDNTLKFVQLANKNMPRVIISNKDNGRYALGISQQKYKFESQWDVVARSTYDFWAIDLKTNNVRPLKEAAKGRFSFSPTGDYVVYYNATDSTYYSLSMADGKERALTSGLNVNFWDELNDEPRPATNYGVGKWYKDGHHVLVYDRYDVWLIDASGSDAPLNLTQGEGRKNNLTFRYLHLDRDEDYIDINKPLLFSAFDNTSKQNGFYTLEGKKFAKAIVDKYTFSVPVKAKDNNTMLFTQSNFNTSPDLYVTTNNWKSEKRLTDINPQMKDYNWGSVEMVEWETYDMAHTQGLLYKPENFDASKKYPVLVYFYDRHTDNLYQYYPPAPSRSIINIPFYVSRGYVVFVPDIFYTVGHPGESAYNYIVSGVEKLSENSWVDKDNIGVQGQSWGGYQVAYLVTCTNIFKAAGAGAPVSNMISAYGGIRWESGMSRQYQYEQTQSRIGKTIWEAPDLYMENSPIFFADRVETPLLIMHNDKDGAVPWYQGIEYFMALRRLHKPVWLLQYNNEAHNLKERRNTKDLSIRLQQFFDHYLKDAPLPAWMKSGVPATEKGRDYGLELTE